MADNSVVKTTPPFSVTHITTSATTAVKAGPGFLRSVLINTKGTSASVTTIYDSLSASGTVIAVIDSLNQVGTYRFDCAMQIGITVVTTGAPDVTVLWH